MSPFALAMTSALFLGLLTSFHPCPLATNIAALSLICRSAGNVRRTILAGLLYTLGRIVAYTCLGLLISTGIITIASTADFLQHYINRLLGPVMILAGMLVAGLLPLPWRHGSLTESAGWKDLIGRTVYGAFLLGVVLALTFCPVSAGLFFGVLIPLAVKHNASFALSAVYGLGTGLPPLVIAAALAKGISVLQQKGRAGRNAGKWLSSVAAAMLIGVGIYFTLHYIFQLL